MKRDFCRQQKCSTQILLDQFAGIIEKYPERKKDFEKKLNEIRENSCQKCLAFILWEWLKDSGFKLVTKIEDIESTLIKKENERT